MYGLGFFNEKINQIDLCTPLLVTNQKLEVKFVNELEILGYWYKFTRFLYVS